jgi:hypothetical protein
MFFSASEVRIVSSNYMYLYFALNDKLNMITCISNKTCLKLKCFIYFMSDLCAAHSELLLKIILIYVTVLYEQLGYMLLNCT